MKEGIKYKIWKKLTIVIVIINLLLCVLTNPVKADGDVEDDGIGGVLLKPVMTLVVTLADALNGALHNFIMGQDQSLIPVDLRTSWWDYWGGIIVGILAGLVVAAIIALTGGIGGVIAGMTFIKGVASVGVTMLVKGAIAGAIVGVWYSASQQLDLYLPVYSFSAEEIFKGNILLFDVDFFNSENGIYLRTQAMSDDQQRL